MTLSTIEDEKSSTWEACRLDRSSFDLSSISNQYVPYRCADYHYRRDMGKYRKVHEDFLQIKDFFEDNVFFNKSNPTKSTYYFVVNENGLLISKCRSTVQERTCSNITIEIMREDSFSGIKELETLIGEIRANIPPDVPQDILELANEAVRGKRELGSTKKAALAKLIAEQASKLTD